MPDDPSPNNDSAALQQRIQAARQRLRTAQVSLLESLEQVSPTSSPGYSPNKQRQLGAPASPLVAAVISSDASAAHIGSPVAGSGCAAAAAVAAVTAAGSSVASQPAGEDGATGIPRGQPARVPVDVTSVRASLLHEVQEDGDDEAWSEEEGSSSSSSDEEERDEQEARESAAAAAADEAVGGGGGGGGDDDDDDALGKTGEDPDVAAKMEATGGIGGGVSRTASGSGLPPPRELFNFGGPGDAGDADDAWAGAPPPRMRTGYPMLHPPPGASYRYPPVPLPPPSTRRLLPLAHPSPTSPLVRSPPHR